MHQIRPRIGRSFSCHRLTIRRAAPSRLGAARAYRFGRVAAVLGRGLLLACAGALLVSAGRPLMAQESPAGLRLQLMARDGGEGRDAALVPVSTGGMLRGGAEIRLRVSVRRQSYVYLIAYHAGTRSALLVDPISGRAEDALLDPGAQREVPGPGRFLYISSREGPETYYAVASAEPPGVLASLLVRMEAAGSDPAAVTAAVRQRFPDAVSLSIRNSGSAPTAPASGEPLIASAGAAAASPAAGAVGGDPQLDVEAMECLYAWLLGKEGGAAGMSPQDAMGLARAEGFTSAAGGCPAGAAVAAQAAAPNLAAADPAEADRAIPSPVTEAPSEAGLLEPLDTLIVADAPAPSPTQSAGSAVQSAAPAAASGADTAGGVALPAPPMPRVDAASTGLAAAPDAAMDDAAAELQSPSLAPPRGDLLVALARAAESRAPLRSIDVNADGNVSSAVVLVVTPTSTGTGVLLDHAGHVLANWHVVRGYPVVSVSFKNSSGAAPSSARTRSARVVRLSKTSDLALLEVDDPPGGVSPVRIADTNEIRTGDAVHTVGHPGGGAWTYALGTIEEVKPGSSWYAGHNLLHRGTVIFAELPDDPGGVGAPMFNNRLELVGIGAMPRSVRGVLTGVSADTIREFLQAPASAQAPAPSTG